MSIGNEPDRCATVAEMGLRMSVEGDGIRGDAESRPELWLPGTQQLRPAVLATWADSLTGIVAGRGFLPRVGVTLDLDLHLYRPIEGQVAVVGRSRIVRAGRNIVIAEAVFTVGDDPTPVALSRAAFMASPDPTHVKPDGFAIDTLQPVRYLSMPVAERARIEWVDGHPEIPCVLENQNATFAIQGGLLALVAEEALRVAAPGTAITSISLRYLRGFREGPARAVADVRDGLATVDLVDRATGRTNVVIVARLA